MGMAGLAASAGVKGASAEDKFPSKPIKIYVPYAPGGATDYSARLVAEKAKISLGQSIIIENKPGAFGILSIEEMAHAKPDGYTLMIGNVTTNCITPVLFPKKMSINYDKDVVAVARLMVTPNVFLLNAAFPAKTFKEFIEYTKKNPGKVRYASSGVASFPHYDTALLAKRAGLDMIHIPYKGGAGEMVKGIVNGEVNVTLLSTPITLPQVKAGTVRAVANINRRLPQFPDLPTLAELGFPGVGTDNWSAVFAPAGTPPAVLNTLYKAFTDAAKDQFVVDAAGKTGTFVFPADSMEETQKWLRDEMAKWRGITQEVKIEMN
jgi:tripartite-type tricarboxylate transporter receptor subunit TctC